MSKRPWAETLDRAALERIQELLAAEYRISARVVDLADRGGDGKTAHAGNVMDKLTRMGLSYSEALDIVEDALRW